METKFVYRMIGEFKAVSKDGVIISKEKHDLRVITSLEDAKRYFNEFKDRNDFIGQVVSVDYSENKDGYFNGHIMREIDLGTHGTRVITLYVHSVTTPKYISVIGDFIDEFAIDIKK